MKSLTLCVPVWNQINDAKGILAQLVFATSKDVNLMIIDNGSTDDYETFIYRYLRPSKVQYIKNTENVGLVRTYQQAYENCETDILAILHNDVYVYEHEWDKRMIQYFEEIDKLGAVGFFGAQGCGPYGERIQDVPGYGVAAGVSNMLEAEIHGLRLHKPWQPAAIFDGFGMIFNMDMLKAGNGFDLNYQFHHIYDRDIALESIKRGFKNIVANVPTHHLSGLTANRNDWQSLADKMAGTEGFKGDKYYHDSNSEIFEKKWEKALPLYINNDFSFRIGAQGNWSYKGDAILELS